MSAALLLALAVASPQAASEGAPPVRPATAPPAGQPATSIPTESLHKVVVDAITGARDWLVSHQNRIHLTLLDQISLQTRKGNECGANVALLQPQRELAKWIAATRLDRLETRLNQRMIRHGERQARDDHGRSLFHR